MEGMWFNIMIIVRKIKLSVVNDDKDSIKKDYIFIKKEIKQQNSALNMGINHMYFLFCAKQRIALSLKSSQEKELVCKERLICLHEKRKVATTEKQQKTIDKSIESAHKKMAAILKLRNQESQRILNEAMNQGEQTSLRDLITNNYELLSDTKDRITQKIIADFYGKNGINLKNILNGTRSIIRYKPDGPWYIRGRRFNIYTKTVKDKTNYYAIYNGMTFKLILAYNRQNSQELELTLNYILDNIYKLCDSSILYNNKKLILNMTIEIPDNHIKELKEKQADIIVGVDLGTQIPACCATNIGCDRVYIGSIEDFLKQRSKIYTRKLALEKSIQNIKGGRGKRKKFKALYRFRQYSRDFAKTYNHMISKQVVEFAKKHDAKQINIELLTISRQHLDKVLNYWSYYELQMYITYKAEKFGINVMTVDPYRTSQSCSHCNNYASGQRITQSKFICSNCKFEGNADYNAAKNISKSEKYITTKEESEYYNNNDNNNSEDNNDNNSEDNYIGDLPSKV